MNNYNVGKKVLTAREATDDNIMLRRKDELCVIDN